MENTVEIYFQDLTKEKQQEIIEVFGDNNNWDVFPIIELSTDFD